MKFIGRFLTCAFVLTIQAAPSLGLNITAGLSEALSEVVKASHAHQNMTRFLKAEFVISKFDKQIVEASRRRGSIQRAALQGLRVLY